MIAFAVFGGTILLFVALNFFLTRIITYTHGVDYLTSASSSAWQSISSKYRYYEKVLSIFDLTEINARTVVHYG